MALDDIKPVSFVKNNMADTLAQINETRSVVVITQNGEARGVLQDPQSYEATRKSIAMLKLLLQRQSDFAQEKTFTQEEVFSRVEARLSSRSSGPTRHKK